MSLDLAAVLRGTIPRVLRVLPDGQTTPGDLSPANLQREIRGVTIDSRTVVKESLFVALVGERVDGHAYAGDALRQGALAAVLSEVPAPDLLRGVYGSDSEATLRPKLVLLVDDPLISLQRLAYTWRMEHDLEVIGITGSIGKTSTKEIVASVLDRKMPVLKSEANLNTEIGLPLVLMRLLPEHRAAVLEMGMYQPGDITLLAQIARPRVGIVTNVAPIHLERVGSIERIARAKSELVAALPSDGLAILNGDDPWTRAMAKTSGIAPVVLVGVASDCRYRAVDVVSHGLDGLSFTAEADGERIPFHSRVPGSHLLHAFLTAIAVGREEGMPWRELQEAVENVQIDARQRVFQGPERAIIIDDSYNAAPLSMLAALELLSSAPGSKIAVLGDMLELGSYEQESHLQVGRRAAEVADWIVARGDRSRWIAQGAVAAGMPAARIVSADSNQEAVDAVRAIMAEPRMAVTSTILPTMHGARTGGAEEAADWSILVKGSRGMKMEDVVQGLRGEL